jgi:hypothetical protein
MIGASRALRLSRFTPLRGTWPADTWSEAGQRATCALKESRQHLVEVGSLRRLDEEWDLRGDLSASQSEERSCGWRHEGQAIECHAPWRAVGTLAFYSGDGMETGWSGASSSPWNVIHLAAET